MWARRCGVAPIWPSRIKVLLQSFATAAVGLTIFNYMLEVDAGYLDLTTPVHSEVLCLSTWPLRHEDRAWWQKDLWLEWAKYRLTTQQFIADNACRNTSSVPALCNVAFVPLGEMDRKVGWPLSRENYDVVNSDFLEVYGNLVLWLTLALWLYISVHDFALLQLSHRNFILDFQGLQDYFPCMDRLWSLTGLRHWRRLVRGKGLGSKGHLARQGRTLALVFLPIVIAYNIVVFLLVTMTVAMMAFIWHPVRLSRLLVFLMSLVLSVLSIIFTVHTLVQIGDSELRQAYAITWTQSSCTCGCLFRVKSGKLLVIASTGVAAAYKAVILAFRCLKGLRRSNWASLLSVMFPIPMAVYDVEWTQPDGNPIQYRQKGEPVQAEPAFDPFALMDEQPESGTTTASLAPVPIKEAQSMRHLEAPETRTNSDEYIGCCGFPCRKRNSRRSPRSAAQDEPKADSVAAAAAALSPAVEVVGARQIAFPGSPGAVADAEQTREPVVYV